MLVLTVSACVTMALKSLTFMPIWSCSSTLNSSKSKLSIVTDVCRGCFSTSVSVSAAKVQNFAPLFFNIWWYKPRPFIILSV